MENVLITQLFSTPKVLYIVGATMALLGLTPLPTLICFIYAILFIAAGRAIESAMEVQNIETEVDEEEETAEEIREDRRTIVSLLQVRSHRIGIWLRNHSSGRMWNQGGDLLGFELL